MQSLHALVLLSGGLDSVTALAWARREGFNVQSAISFTYGQRHAREVEAATDIAAFFGVPHQVVALSVNAGSHLTDLGDIPQGRNLAALNERIAPT